MYILLFQWHDQYWRLWLKLTKNRQKIVQKHWYLLHWIHHNQRNWWLWKCFIGKVIGHIEEKENGSKCLVFDSTDENKEILTKYTQLWDGIKNEIKTINGGKAS